MVVTKRDKSELCDVCAMAQPCFSIYEKGTVCNSFVLDYSKLRAILKEYHVLKGDSRHDN